jgi:hypothetical protein
VENGGGLARTAAEGVILMQAGLGPRGGGEALIARQVGRRSCGAKAAVRRDELGGASMQPNTTATSCSRWNSPSPPVRNRGPLCETLLLFHVCKAANL